jgi:hypothetical protein
MNELNKSVAAINALVNKFINDIIENKQKENKARFYIITKSISVIFNKLRETVIPIMGNHGINQTLMQNIQLICGTLKSLFLILELEFADFSNFLKETNDLDENIDDEINSYITQLDSWTPPTSTLPSTLPSTLQSTLQSTLPSTLPSTLQSTLPSTLPSFPLHPSHPLHPPHPSHPPHPPHPPHPVSKVLEFGDDIDNFINDLDYPNYPDYAVHKSMDDVTYGQMDNQMDNQLFSQKKYKVNYPTNDPMSGPVKCHIGKKYYPIQGSQKSVLIPMSKYQIEHEQMLHKDSQNMMKTKMKMGSKSNNVGKMDSQDYGLIPKKYLEEHNLVKQTSKFMNDKISVNDPYISEHGECGEYDSVDDENNEEIDDFDNETFNISNEVIMKIDI